MNKAMTWTTQRPKSLDWDHVKASVSGDGRADISTGRLAECLRLDPREAYALGKWLVDTYGDA